MKAWLQLCMKVCMYIGMHVCTYVRTYACTQMHVHVYAQHTSAARGTTSPTLAAAMGHAALHRCHPRSDSPTALTNAWLAECTPLYGLAAASTLEGPLTEAAGSASARLKVVRVSAKSGDNCGVIKNWMTAVLA